MNLFLLIVLSVPVLNVAWWWWADRRLRGLPHAGRWRVLHAAFVGGNFALYAWVILARRGGLGTDVPSVLLAECYIWNLVVVPLAALGAASAVLVRALAAGTERLAGVRHAPRTADAEVPPTDDPVDPPNSAPAMALSRRQVLVAAVVALPPVATALAQARALSQLATFRIRRLDVVVPRLPPALDGVTIAHVSDLHVGRFTHGEILRELVTRTNELRPDLVFFTGDLIDHALADLPEGLDTLRQLEPRERLLMCEGNHDLFEGRERFERQVRAAGVRLLLNESAMLNVRGQDVQVLGLRWDQRGGGRAVWLDEQMARVLPLRRPGTFTVLLAHHPHAFDQAADAEIPLTLSGHTHGGQLMLTEDIGAGPLLFKYWSGLYRRGESSLVVSNGVGNWFPLRINAPAEILRLTLRSAASGPADRGA
jgi:hypothetical protein